VPTKEKDGPVEHTVDILPLGQVEEVTILIPINGMAQQFTQVNFGLKIVMEDGIYYQLVKEEFNLVIPLSSSISCNCNQNIV